MIQEFKFVSASTIYKITNNNNYFEENNIMGDNRRSIFLKMLDEESHVPSMQSSEAGTEILRRS